MATDQAGQSRADSRALEGRVYKGIEERSRFATDVMKLPFRPDPAPQWPWLLGTAAVSSLATLFVARNFFPTGKKIRHKISADYDVGSEIFARTIGHLLGPSLVDGNKFTPLEKGDKIFTARRAAIGSEQRHIQFETYLITEVENTEPIPAPQTDVERAREQVPTWHDV